jgi:hypothetical protein
MRSRIRTSSIWDARSVEVTVGSIASSIFNTLRMIAPSIVPGHRRLGNSMRYCLSSDKGIGFGFGSSPFAPASSFSYSLALLLSLVGIRTMILMYMSPRRLAL